MNSYKQLLAMITTAFAVAGLAQASKPAANKYAAELSRAVKNDDAYGVIDAITLGSKQGKLGLSPLNFTALSKAVETALSTPGDVDDAAITEAANLINRHYHGRGNAYLARLNQRSADFARRRPAPAAHAAPAAAANDGDGDSVLNDSAASSVLDESAAPESVDAILGRSAAGTDAHPEVLDESAASDTESLNADVAAPAAAARRTVRFADSAAATAAVARPARPESNARAAAAAIERVNASPRASRPETAQQRAQRENVRARMIDIVNASHSAPAAAAPVVAPLVQRPFTQEQAQANAIALANRIEEIGARINALAQGSRDHHAILNIATDLRNCEANNVVYNVDYGNGDIQPRSTAQMVGCWTAMLQRKISTEHVDNAYSTAIRNTNFDVALAHTELDRIIRQAREHINHEAANVSAAAAAPVAPAAAQDSLAPMRAQANAVRRSGSQGAPSATANAQ